MREKILTAAEALLREGGLGAAQMDDIAARAEIAAGSIYKHFATKAELFAEVFRILCDREVKAMSEELESPGNADDRIARALEGFARRALKSRRAAYALMAEPVDAAVDAERMIFRRAYGSLLAAAVKRGVARGELPLQDPELTAMALVGAVAESLLGPLSKTTRDGEDLAVQRIIELCRRAITGAPASAAKRNAKRNAKRKKKSHGDA